MVSAGNNLSYAKSFPVKKGCLLAIHPLKSA